MFTADCQDGALIEFNCCHCICQLLDHYLSPFQILYSMMNATLLFAVPCFSCGNSSAWWRCVNCVGDFKDQTSQGFISFCCDCVKRAHKHPQRSRHKYEMAVGADEMKLELLSVICIETSHYVCFTHPEDQWIFFDSMARRVCKYHLLCCIAIVLAC